MSVNSVRTVTINFTGDVISDKIYSAAQNPLSPGSITLHELASGDNTIAIPVITGISVKGMTIIPPIGNIVTMTLKGNVADVGIPLSLTDPTSLAFQAAPANIVLTTGGVISGLRIVWT
jgi:protein involved in polysaccharide export with SLBB domain